MALALQPIVNGQPLDRIVFEDEEEGRGEQAFLNLLAGMSGDTVEWVEEYV